MVDIELASASSSLETVYILTLQATKSPCLLWMLNCPTYASALRRLQRYLPDYHFKNQDKEGNVREFNLNRWWCKLMLLQTTRYIIIYK
jgi:hypothetical protein